MRSIRRRVYPAINNILSVSSDSIHHLCLLTTLLSSCPVVVSRALSNRCKSAGAEEEEAAADCFIIYLYICEGRRCSSGRRTAELDLVVGALLLLRHDDLVEAHEAFGEGESERIARSRRLAIVHGAHLQGRRRRADERLAGEDLLVVRHELEFT